MKIVYEKTDEWYIEWQRVVQRVTTNDKEWSFQLFFFFFQIKEEPTTKHPKENFLNLEEDLWRRPIELRAETTTQKEILTVRSKNCRSSCLQICTKIVFLKILQHLLIDLQASRPATFLKRYSNTDVFLCWSPFLRKLQVLKPANLLKRRLHHKCSLVNTAKFLKTAFSIEHL